MSWHTSGSFTHGGHTYTVGNSYPISKSITVYGSGTGSGAYTTKSGITLTITGYYDQSSTYPYPIRVKLSDPAYVRFTNSSTLYGAITSYTVSFNANGGSSPPSAQTKKYGFTLTLTTSKPSRTGYTFSRWNTKSDNTGIGYSSGGSYTSNSSATLYAIWTANKYTVTLNANGGSGGTGSVSATYAANMPSATMPTRSGYKFAGYYDTSAETGGTQYYTATGTSARTWNKTAATTLYARWTASSATISFEGNGATDGEMADQTVNQTVATPLQKNSFIKTGYHLIGWAESSEGEIIYQDQGLITIPAGTTEKTLYAIWQINNYYINYIGNDNDYGLMSKQICTYNSPINLYPNIYRKRKKQFKYWANLESFTKRISEEYSENNVTISYQLNDDEIFISASAGINQDGVDNPKGFNIIRGPFYNKHSRIVTVTGNGISSAEEKEFYLDIVIADSSYIANLEITVAEIPSETVSFELKSGEQIIINSELAPQDFTSTTINVELKYPSKYTTITCPIPEWAESINIISSGAEYDTYVNQATVLNLCSGHEEIYNLYVIWQEGLSKPVRIFNDIISYIGQNTYSVGSIFITNTNQNPSSFLWGEWKLVKKQFIPKTINNFITYNTTNTQGTCNSVAEVYPTAINIKGYWYPKVAHADSTLTIGSYDLATLGLTECKQVPWVAVSDGLNSAFLTYINNTIQAVQVVPATNATSVAANASYPVYFNTFVMFENPKNMLDNACDKFFWKRIK